MSIKYTLVLPKSPTDPLPDMTRGGIGRMPPHGRHLTGIHIHNISVPLCHGTHRYLCSGDHQKHGEDQYMLTSHTANTKCVHDTKLHHTRRSDQSKLPPILRTPNHDIIRSTKNRERSGAILDTYSMDSCQISAPLPPSAAHSPTSNPPKTGVKNDPSMPQPPPIGGGGSDNELNLKLRDATLLPKFQLHAFGDGRAMGSLTYVKLPGESI